MVLVSFPGSRVHTQEPGNETRFLVVHQPDRRVWRLSHTEKNELFHLIREG